MGVYFNSGNTYIVSKDSLQSYTLLLSQHVLTCLYNKARAVFSETFRHKKSFEDFFLSKLSFGNESTPLGLTYNTAVCLSKKETGMKEGMHVGPYS